MRSHLIACLSGLFVAVAAAATADGTSGSAAGLESVILTQAAQEVGPGTYDISEVARAVEATIAQLAAIGGANEGKKSEGCQSFFSYDDGGEIESANTHCFTCTDKGCCNCEISVPPSAGDGCTTEC